MLEWNVMIYSINRNQIETYNVFNHVRFREDIVKHIKQNKSKEEFSELVKKSLMYYFWSKSEWEILITPWCSSSKNIEEKVDVYKQVMNNWNHFIDYVWENRKSI